MKAYENKYNIAYLLLGILIMSICHAAFNHDAYGKDTDSKVGIARHMMPSKAKASSRAASKVLGDDIGNNISTATVSPTIEVFTGFSSDHESLTEGSGDPTVVPVVKKKKSYLYVSFKVTSKTKVDIRWTLDDAEVNEIINFEDPVDGGGLLPTYWYFAWYNAKDDLSSSYSLHNVAIEVKTPDQSWGLGEIALFSFRSY